MSFKPEVIAGDSDQWVGVAIRFATIAEAERHLFDLATCWPLVRMIRVVESTAPVNYCYVNGKLELVDDDL